MSASVTRLWSPNAKYTVEQALADALNEHREYELSEVLILGTYKDNGLLVKPSRMSNADAMWLMNRGIHNLLTNS